MGGPTTIFATRQVDISFTVTLPLPMILMESSRSGTVDWHLLLNCSTFLERMRFDLEFDDFSCQFQTMPTNLMEKFVKPKS